MNFIDANRMSNKTVHSATNNNDQLWHQHRLGHMGKSKFYSLKMIDGINLINE